MIGLRTLAAVLCCSGLLASMACSSAAPTRTGGAPAAAQPAVAQPAAAPATGSDAAAPQADAGRLPVYQPSSVLSHTEIGPGSTDVLTSPDPVDKVAAFYRDALAQGGWQTTSASGTLPWSQHLMARRDKQGVTIQISNTGSGASISVTTYPV
jgi:hypothetical protein